MLHPGSITASQGQPPDEDRAGTTKGHLLPTRAVAQQERPVLPAGGLRRTSRLAALPLRHAARTAAAATRLSWLAADQVAARTAEQLFGTLGELKGGGLMALFTEPRFASALRNLTPPREYALVWRATLSVAGLFAQLGATVPTRGFHLTYSPGFRDSVIGAPRLFPQADHAGRKTGTDG